MLPSGRTLAWGERTEEAQCHRALHVLVSPSLAQYAMKRQWIVSQRTNAGLTQADWSSSEVSG